MPVKKQVRAPGAPHGSGKAVVLYLKVALAGKVMDDGPSQGRILQSRGLGDADWSPGQRAAEGGVHT